MTNAMDRTRPFLGGWRSKVTGNVYWNACTQTSSRGSRGQEKKETRAQTDFLVDKFTSTKHDAAVQTSTFPDVRDRIVDGSQKKKATKLEDPTDRRILESVVKIQRFYRIHPAVTNIQNHKSTLRTLPDLSQNPHFWPEHRGWRKLERNVAEHLYKRLFDVARRAHRGGRTASRPASVSVRVKDTDGWETEEVPGHYRSRDFTILNRTAPRTATDFETLYNLLDRWRNHETERAGELLFDASRIALGSLILSKEVDLLRAIDATKANVKLRRKERAYRKFLDELSRPVVWRDHRGEPIHVETPRVQRAKAFKETYDALAREGVPAAERAELLTKLRKDVEPHTCKESDELLRVLDQELFLLSRNVDESKLNWLRCRTRMAFLGLARRALQPEPEESAHFRSGCKTICRSCGRPLPAVEKFARENRRSTTCNYCLYAKLRAGPTIVLEPYRKLLRDVKRREAKLHCYTSLAFVVDPWIVYRLVNGIWQGRSAISENDRLEELRLVRFRNDEPWSPWNCLLLTESEASLHRRVDNLEQFYGSTILQKFYTKNLQAKIQFDSVAEFKSGRETRASTPFLLVD